MFNIELKLHLGPEVEHSYPGSDAFAPALTTRKWCIHTPLHSIFRGKSFAFVPPRKWCFRTRGVRLLNP